MTLRCLLFFLSTLHMIDSVAEDAPVNFKRLQLDLFYWSEGANFGDLNNDGVLDTISGPYWWEGPGFKRRHQFYPAETTFSMVDNGGNRITYPGYEGALGSKNAYSVDNFFTFSYDFSGDGWNDILTFGIPGAPAYLFINPGEKSGNWERHMVFDGVDNESPGLLDVTGDGRPEIVCNYHGQIGYAEYNPQDPTAPWRFRAITNGDNWHKYSHGLGVGDIDGDGRNDIVFKDGWYRQPDSLADEPLWQKHEYLFSERGGAQMLVYDVNDDGLSDVITGLYGHGYGLAWYEQNNEGGSITFRQHIIMSETGQENSNRVNFSQLHALALVDVDGDGLKDIVTGKTFWAHGPDYDAGRNDPPVLYWFRLTRSGDQVDWKPYLIDNDSGIGRQIGIGDITGDGRPDIIIGNKKGTMVFLNGKP